MAFAQDRPASASSPSRSSTSSKLAPFMLHARGVGVVVAVTRTRLEDGRDGFGANVRVVDRAASLAPAVALATLITPSSLSRKQTRSPTGALALVVPRVHSHVVFPRGS